MWLVCGASSDIGFITSFLAIHHKTFPDNIVIEYGELMFGKLLQTIRNDKPKWYVVKI